MDDYLYDTPGYCHHGLNVDLVNKKQILFIPVLHSNMISEAAVIFDYPMGTEEIGRLIFQFFKQMKQRNLTLHSPYKNYWFMPKGIRSFKKYVEATFSVTLEWDGDIFGVYRWFPAPDRGFTVEGPGSYNVTINNSVAAKELGEFILQQFDYIERKRQRS
ncbi:hypothetical protein [Pseudoflavonifractor phocaeensis]|uniref:hypothetical protein n=1 Tax=Pseudoflavonifractor phocaeensis TaxID=1870988 RepID=UPI0021099E86|nr:hypothetical protein [Pseudoflavonifractor phocaeensis]MCQ4864952.1 hypothetical protein [Pseudoflavonifractor phocaeensis]